MGRIGGSWSHGEHAMELKAERERVQRKMSIEIANWQASSEAYRLDAERLRAAASKFLKEQTLENAENLERALEQSVASKEG